MAGLPPFRPIAADPWDRRKAAHLLRRAGFGPLPPEIDAAARAGLDATVAKLLAGPAEAPAYPPPTWVAAAAADPPPEQLTQQERMRFFLQNQVRNQETKGWWLQRMAMTRWPLQEKMTLFWHGHFATEAKKVVLSANVLQQ